MDVNSPKPPETGFDNANAINALREWIARENVQRIPQVLDLLAQHTAKAWASGQPSPAVDPDTLRQFHVDAHGGRISDMPASKWLSSSAVRKWWDTRQSAREQAFEAAGINAVPTLTIIKGGGRTNQTLYRLDLQAHPTGDDSPDEIPAAEAGAAAAGLVRYQVEPVKAAWWLRPIIGQKPFRMRSWRGYLLIGVVAAEALAILALWGFLFLVLRGTRPLQVGDLGLLLSLLGVTWTWWHFMQPIIRLPIERVTIANDLLLAWSELYGQLRLTRDAKSKIAGGWFQCVRHSGTCPLCAGEVEIAPGGRAFPERLVGRCSDSPLEHVFSFDPVSLSGRSLY